MRKANAEKTEKRRRQVLDAATQCFREKGFAGASIADICREAGMSPGHLYHYFASKDDIVAAIAEEDRAAAAQTMGRLAEEDQLIDALLLSLNPAVDLGDYAIDGALAFDVFAEAGRNPRVGAAVRSIYREVNDGLAALISEAQAKGQIPSSIDPHGAALTITALVEGLVVMGVSHDDTELARATPTVKRMIRAALGETDIASDDRPAPIRTRRARRG
ncbi:TetR/AcrR family transcriptional regulator [Blastomonas sp. UPD001]|uniref:TetR/AcrR family transcriptional regulator n=1 Tax=Blastomonas sp. UPD001 TaxID=2217673 RepID=UPI0018E5903C|nr:TetR/AcrR family transcriptional regulator [Blastomonas sp. UPD001]